MKVAFADQEAIPDRVSFDPASPFFFEKFRQIGVIIDGAVIFNCAEFCVSEGWVKRIVRDAKGRVKVERGKPVSVLIRGDVRPYWRK